MFPDDRTVFIASRFHELADVRRALRERIAEYGRRFQLVAMDLDDGASTHRPPLAESLARLRRCRFMILLLGESYGDDAPDHSRSYTHLEHDAALAADGEIRVLAFAIGPSYANRTMPPSDDPKLAAFRRQVSEAHTVGYFRGDEPTAEIAARIVNDLVAALCDLHFGLPEEGAADDAFVSDDLPEDDEVASLEALFGGTRAAQSGALSAAQSLAEPARLAALEQCREAADALAIGKFALARKHLVSALEWRPLDIEANYRLARLGIATGSRRRCAEAIGQLDIVRRLHARGGQWFLVSHCLQLQARAAMGMGDSQTALALAEEACTVKPGYGRAHYEFAAILARNGQPQAAIKRLLRAIRLYFPLRRQARLDPVFAAITNDVERAVARWIERERTITDAIHANEREVVRIVDGQPAELPSTANAPNPLWLARLSAASIGRQHAKLREAWTRIVDAVRRRERADSSTAVAALAGEQAALQRACRDLDAEILANTRRMGRRRVAIGACLVLAPLICIGLWLAGHPVASVLVLAFGVIVLTVLVLPPSEQAASVPAVLARACADRGSHERRLRQLVDEQHQLVRERQQLTQSETTAREMFSRAYAAWLPSLRARGRHRPYFELSGDVSVLVGAVVVASPTAANDGLHHYARVEFVDPLRAVTGESSTLRLYLVSGVVNSTLVLSEARAYGQLVAPPEALRSGIGAD